MKLVMYVLLLSLSTYVSVYTKSACIIIHGTWGQSSSWYQPGGDFYEKIKSDLWQLKLTDQIVSFRWSGLLGDLAQKKAGQDLAKKILEYDFVILIAHSHGATVGIIASMVLAQKNSDSKLSGKIKRFYALGVPVDRSATIYPSMKIVTNFYNMFSFGDLIQPVHGVYGRSFAESSGLTNIVVTLNGAHPSHFDLHEAVIGQHLLKIPDFFQAQNVENFAIFQNGQSAEISFFENKYPKYSPIFNIEKLLALDDLAFELAQKAFFRSKKDGAELSS